MNRQQIERAVTYGFVDGHLPHSSRFSPLLIDNQKSFTMSRAIRAELRHAESFVFSVAFVTPGALNVLKQDLLDFKGSGRIITSNYLGFNSPETYRELLGLGNVEVGVVPANMGFHAKGYVFRGQDQTTAIVGSSNLTVSALSSNHEWNFRFSAHDHGHVVAQIEEAIALQTSIAEPLNEEWLEEFECTYSPRVPISWLDRRASHLTSDQAMGTNLVQFSGTAPLDRQPRPVLQPNEMQKSALASLSRLRADGKSTALVISATGTGKTMLAALDVRAVEPERLLFLAHREQILDKATQEFQLVLGKPSTAFGKLSGSSRDLRSPHLFATTQSFIRAIGQGLVAPKDYDYVIVDEVHKAGAKTYIDIIKYLQPKFMLGMSATPERTDGFNVFELFNYNLAYEIRLQQALEENMLAPFHYFGITDYTTAAGTTIDEFTELRYLASNERADYLVQKLAQYGQKGVQVRGLIFCSRNHEARQLAELLNCRSVNGRPLRTKALSGTDSVDYRESVVQELEQGLLDYIITVDVFNEGIDIPSLNQIVMMRQTQSSIVFTQQLGRGLRKYAGKDYLVVIDFIGNYANNYLIPTALFGDASHNKEQLRRKLIGVDGDHIIAGISSINFDKIARERVFDSLTKATLNSMANLKQSYMTLKNRLGREPMLLDFARHETMDPVVIGPKCGHYAEFVRRTEEPECRPPALDASSSAILTMLTTELLSGKRPQELLLLQQLCTRDGPISVAEYTGFLKSKDLDASEETVSCVKRVLNLEWFTQSERSKYGGAPLVTFDGTCFHLSPHWRASWQGSGALRRFATDVINTGLHLSHYRYHSADKMVVGERYSRKDACWLLNWKQNEQATVYGYKVDRDSNTCPIFVTYHKADDIAESTKYEERFIDQSTFHWSTRSRRNLESKEVREIVSGSVPLHLFVKKDDAEGSDFIYLGLVRPNDATQTTMPGKDGTPLSVVTMNLELGTALDGATFDYFVGTA